MPPTVTIIEVSPRDGLQNIPTPIPTGSKIALITRLARTGLRHIELTSLVSHRRVPQLADAQRVLADGGIRELLGVDEDNEVNDDENEELEAEEKVEKMKQLRLLRAPVLVPNVRGLETGLRYGVRDVAVFVSASEGFSRANGNCSVDEGLDRAAEVVKLAAAKGVSVRGYISCIFHDPFDGPTPEAAVLHAVQKLLAMGCYEISLGDTLGTGKPADVRRLLVFLYRHGICASKLAGHFHDTHGQAIANVCTAYRLGIRTFDSSIAGLGGCPFAPGAKGNVATEELVQLFEGAGIRTNVNLKKLLQVKEWVYENILRYTNRESVVDASVERVESEVVQRSICSQA